MMRIGEIIGPKERKNLAILLTNKAPVNMDREYKEKFVKDAFVTSHE